MKGRITNSKIFFEWLRLIVIIKFGLVRLPLFIYLLIMREILIDFIQKVWLEICEKKIKNV